MQIKQRSSSQPITAVGELNELHQQNPRTVGLPEYEWEDCKQTKVSNFAFTKPELRASEELNEAADCACRDGARRNGRRRQRLLVGGRHWDHVSGVAMGISCSGVCRLSWSSARPSTQRRWWRRRWR